MQAAFSKPKDVKVRSEVQNLLRRYSRFFLERSTDIPTTGKFISKK
jgi:hypothetical protein